MINPKELRIGNRVNYANANSVISEIGLTYVSLYPNTKIHAAGLVSILLLEPIPLTHEILEKSGFEYNKAHEQYIKIYAYQNNGFYKTMALDDDYDSDYFRFSLFDMPINSVHQLQNLFFALTGEELEIKL